VWVGGGNRCGLAVVCCVVVAGVAVSRRRGGRLLVSLSLLGGRFGWVGGLVVVMGVCQRAGAIGAQGLAVVVVVVDATASSVMGIVVVRVHVARRPVIAAVLLLHGPRVRVFAVDARGVVMGEAGMWVMVVASPMVVGQEGALSTCGGESWGAKTADSSSSRNGG
jgi:hypothetical protein